MARNFLVREDLIDSRCLSVLQEPILCWTKACLDLLQCITLIHRKRTSNSATGLRESLGRDGLLMDDEQGAGTSRSFTILHFNDVYQVEPAGDAERFATKVRSTSPCIHPPHRVSLYLPQTDPNHTSTRPPVSARLNRLCGSSQRGLSQ